MTLPNNACHAPLHPLDRETQTHGCRQASPNVCGKNSLPGVCAFVRKDNICLSPPNSWKRQYEKLLRSPSVSRLKNEENNLPAESRQP